MSEESTKELLVSVVLRSKHFTDTKKSRKHLKQWKWKNDLFLLSTMSILSFSLPTKFNNKILAIPFTMQKTSNSKNTTNKQNLFWFFKEKVLLFDWFLEGDRFCFLEERVLPSFLNSFLSFQWARLILRSPSTLDFIRKCSSFAIVTWMIEQQQQK